MARTKLDVAFVLLPNFTLTPFATIVDMLRLAADEGDRSRPIDCRWTILGTPTEPTRASCGAEVPAWERLADLRHGGYGTHALLKGPTLLPIPADLDAADATVLYSTFQTAHVGLFHRGQLQAGQWVLVLGASSGAKATKSAWSRRRSGTSLALYFSFWPTVKTWAVPLLPAIW